MSDDTVLELLAKQEEELRFESVSIDDIVAIGEKIVSAIKAKGAFAYVLMRVNGLEVFAQAMKGTSGNIR